MSFALTEIACDDRRPSVFHDFSISEETFADDPTMAWMSLTYRCIPASKAVRSIVTRVLRSTRLHPGCLRGDLERQLGRGLQFAAALGYGDAEHAGRGLLGMSGLERRQVHHV